MLSQFFMQTANAGFNVSVIIIYKLFYSAEMVYLLSGAKFGFHREKCCLKTYRGNAGIKTGLVLKFGLALWKEMVFLHKNIANTYSCKLLFAGFLISKRALVWGNGCERLHVEIFVRVLRSSRVKLK